MASENQELKELKIVLIGQTNSGKSTFVLQFIADYFNSEMCPTIGASYMGKVISVNDILVRLRVWDITGDIRYRYLLSMYYRDANAILAFYDKSDYKSFQAAKDSVESFSRENDQSFIGMVVANKADMNSEVSTEEGIEFASSLGALYMEVSAKTGENVKLCFEVAARACLALE